MIPILYLDNAILVCVKPAGILSQGAPEGGTDLPVLLSRQCGGQVYPIHRLDRGVGGVMVYARTKPAAGALSRAVQLGALKKEYLCIVSGGPEAAEGIYRDLLFHDSTRNKTFVVQRLRKGVKEASLSYRVLDTSGNRSLVRIQLHTGRTHQIRVQFASRGMPLLGDRKYGGEPAEQIALWSCHLSFPHPDTGAALSFQQSPAGTVWQNFPRADFASIG